MRWFLAIVFLTGTSAPALAQSSGTLSYTQDARTEASDEEVRTARRAYRAECQRYQTVDYCECMTGGMAQALAPADLGTATALLAHDLTNAPAPAALDRNSVSSAQAAAADFEPSCRANRR